MSTHSTVTYTKQNLETVTCSAFLNKISKQYAFGQYFHEIEKPLSNQSIE